VRGCVAAMKVRRGEPRFQKEFQSGGGLAAFEESKLVRAGFTGRNTRENQELEIVIKRREYLKPEKTEKKSPLWGKS